MSPWVSPGSLPILGTLVMRGAALFGEREGWGGGGLCPAPWHPGGARDPLAQLWGPPAWHPTGGLGGWQRDERLWGRVDTHPPAGWGKGAVSMGAQAKGAQGSPGTARSVPTGVTVRTRSVPQPALVLPSPQPRGEAPAARLAPLTCGGEASTCQAPRGGNLPEQAAGNGITGCDINLPPGTSGHPPCWDWMDMESTMGTWRGWRFGLWAGGGAPCHGRGGVAQCKGWGAGGAAHSTVHSSSCLSHLGSRCSLLPVLARLPPVASLACPMASLGCLSHGVPCPCHGAPACAMVHWVWSLPAPVACAVCVCAHTCVQRATCACAPCSVYVCARTERKVCVRVTHAVRARPTHCLCACVHVCVYTCMSCSVCVHAHTCMCVPHGVCVHACVPHAVPWGHGMSFLGFPPDGCWCRWGPELGSQERAGWLRQRGDAGRAGELIPSAVDPLPTPDLCAQPSRLGQRRPWCRQSRGWRLNRAGAPTPGRPRICHRCLAWGTRSRPRPPLLAGTLGLRASCQRRSQISHIHQDGRPGHSAGDRASSTKGSGPPPGAPFSPLRPSDQRGHPQSGAVTDPLPRDALSEGDRGAGEPPPQPLTS